jgi:superfamily II DNA or RNA helicase
MSKHKKLLLPYQVQNTENIINILNKNNSVLDASDTGTGKTYSSVCACAILELKPIIICPKAVMSNWKNVCKIFKVKPFFIVNYETLKYCKYYDEKSNRIECPYISIKKVKVMDEFGEPKYTEQYEWLKLPKDVIFIFDEVHKCSNIHTYNGLLLRAARETTKNKIILLSATLADNEQKFKIFYYVLNFIDREEMEKNNTSFKECMRLCSMWLNYVKNPMYEIHQKLFPEKATRMKIETLGDLFPETQITATPYSMGKTTEEKIESEYKLIFGALLELKDQKSKDKSSILVKILRSHQKIELLKIPTFMELALDFVDNGLSVVIFVNFTKTIETLASLLKTDCLIYGEQTDKQRQQAIDDFQSNKKHILICNSKAGGVGISLHDVHKKRRRASIISPCWSSIDLVQVLGRIHRAGGTKSLQRIIYSATGVEEKIATKLQAKLKNLKNINDGDLNLSNIKFESKLQEFSD